MLCRACNKPLGPCCTTEYRGVRPSECLSRRIRISLARPMEQAVHRIRRLDEMWKFVVPSCLHNSCWHESTAELYQVLVGTEGNNQAGKSDDSF